jgi:hypothetical protein
MPHYHVTIMKKTLLPLRRHHLWFTDDNHAPQYGTPLLTNELRLKIRKQITKKRTLLVETLVDPFLEIQQLHQGTGLGFG